MHLINILAFVAFLNIDTTTASCIHNTHLHPRSMGEDGKKLELPNFSYSGNSGPTNWQAIDEKYAQCASGSNQSPIDIRTAEIRKTKPGDVRMEIPEGQKIIFENIGTNVEVLVKGATMVGGKKFQLKQFHYHTPSEHKIDSEYYPVEVHMVHEAEDNPEQIAVIVFLFQLTSDPSSPSTNSSSPSSIFSQVLTSISSIPQPGSSIELPSPSSEQQSPSPPPLSFTSLLTLLPTTAFYTYTGSLTTPPCSEGVTFLIATEALSMPVDPYNAMKKVVRFNSRFGQNGLGEQNLLQVSRKELEREDAMGWRVVERWDVVPMPVDKGEGRGEGKRGVGGAFRERV